MSAGEYITLVVEVPNDKVGLVIGRAGATIKELEQRSGCRVQITPDSLWQGKSEPRPIQLQGYQYQLDICKSIISEKVQVPADKLSSTQTFQGGTTTTPRSYVTTNANETVVHVPNESVGLVIGKSGQTIKYLETTTGARIQIAKECPAGSNMRPITLTGPPHLVESAKNMILSKVTETRAMWLRKADYRVCVNVSAYISVIFDVTCLMVYLLLVHGARSCAVS
jgi:far upstream element-binding protein